MIAKVQPSRQNSRSSFRRLLDYLIKEHDPETGEILLRGDVGSSSLKKTVVNTYEVN